jgi:hypothetical protein
MKAKDFIEEKLRLLASKFKEVHIRYEYRTNTRSHLVEIIPLRFFEENESYFEEEANIEDEFEKLYPEENIIFISEGSLTEIKNADLELGYEKFSFDYNSFIINFEVDGYSEEVENQSFENYALAA